MMPTRKRTVVLGVDSVDLLLVDRWRAAGLLPFFDSMSKNATRVRLSTVSRVLQGALWPTLLSGRSPGAHGTYLNDQLTSGSYNLDPVGADHADLAPYYLQLEANGIRCALVDIPNDLPRKELNGLQVVDWLTEFKFWHFQTGHPADKADIEKRFGTIDPDGGFGPTVPTLEGYRDLRRKLERSIRLKGALTRELLQRQDLDHVFVVFGEPHKAGHHLWKFMDPAHPDHQDAEPFLRDAVLAIYQQIDRQLGELAACLSPHDNLLVFSDHGMQANYRGDHLIAPLLQRLGMCAPGQRPVIESAKEVLERAPATSGSPASVEPSRRPAIRLPLRKLAPAIVRKVAPAFVSHHLRRRFGAGSRIDWSRTRVFHLPTDRNSYLRVNLRGREPAGIVEPGREYDELLAQLGKEFRALVNVETGKPAVEEVFRPRELFPGPRVDDLPDLVILWSADAPINSIESPTVGRLSVRAHEDRSGNHRAEGFILARGPAIRSHGADLWGDIQQIPSTLLALHGVPIPARFEMAPIQGLLAQPVTPPDQARPRVPHGPGYPAAAALSR
jgi:predicted AlkP superfamily phosphohydrolase/phosphomutase